ncbi:wasp-1 [Holotrichia oblita]|uniref:Wasp-1 n=1 Tax=Holotrichia oblita TaxID=644536 RepID=A0ACB9SYJ5_HOLOL|nr:wasp-1 [Holotrichia oblita]
MNDDSCMTIAPAHSIVDPLQMAESDICSFAQLKKHYAANYEVTTNLFAATNRPRPVQALYEAAAKTPIHLMRQMDKWRRDGHRSSRFFLCTPVLGARRRKIRSKVDIDIETRMPAAVEELRRWTSNEAIGDVTITPDCQNRVPPSSFLASDGDLTDGTVLSDDEPLDHKLPSPEEQAHVLAMKFPPEVVAVDISGRSFDRLSLNRRSLLHTELEDVTSVNRRKGRTRKPRSRRRNTIAGTDQKELRDAVTGVGEEKTSPSRDQERTPQEVSPVTTGSSSRSKSSDILRSNSKKESPEPKKSHFNSLKQWGKNRLKLINKYTESKTVEISKTEDVEQNNTYEVVTSVKRRSLERKISHERQPSCSSSEKSSVANQNVPAVKLRESSQQRRLRRSSNENKDEMHSSSGNWSASSESGRASIGSEITTHPKSTTSAATSSNSLNTHTPGSVNSRRKYNPNNSTSGSVTSEGTLTPDIIHDLHEDGETSSVYSCDTEGYYTSFHMDSGLKTLKEEDGPATPLHSTTTFSNSSSSNVGLSAENEYELFGRGSTSTTTSSAGTVCTTLRASESSRSLSYGPAVPERKSSLNKSKEKSPESSLERDISSDKTGTVKRSPLNHNKAPPTIVGVIHKNEEGDVSPDSGHNTSNSPIESANSPNGNRSCSEFEFSESSDMEGADRIERIRIKTTINSSRIPSMCAITPPHSDDESVKNYDMVKERNTRNQINKENLNDLDILKETKKIQLINVNPISGYATIETVDIQENQTGSQSKALRAPSPSGGSVVIKESPKSQQSQPIFKATLMPLNNMFGKLKNNLSNLRKSPGNVAQENNNGEQYEKISDAKNNNNKSPIYDSVNKNLKAVLSGKIRETEYVSLNELPSNETISESDSLERRKRQGARVTLNAEGKVVYSSDSLPRRKGATTFEPGPFVKKNGSPVQSPIPAHRNLNVRPVNSQDQSRPLSPQLGKVVIRASSGTSEIIRMPPTTIVTPTSPKPNNSRGAYVHVLGRNEAKTILTDSGKEKTVKMNNSTNNYNNNNNNNNNITKLSRSESYKIANNQLSLSPKISNVVKDKLDIEDRIEKEIEAELWRERINYPASVSPKICDRRCHVYGSMNHAQELLLASPKRRPHLQSNPHSTALDHHRSHLMEPDFNTTPSYLFQRDTNYSTLPSRKFHHLNDLPERSVTPDITRDLGNSRFDMGRSKTFELRGDFRISQQLRQYKDNQTNNDVPCIQNESLRISPIDPRGSSFKCSTPAPKVQNLKAAVNLENRLLSPKKSTMTNEELYAVIHKSKKKLNISDEDLDRGASPIDFEIQTPKATPKSPETGYLGEKSRSRLSWSPGTDDLAELNDKYSNESRSRQSWACKDRKGPVQTSRLDFKKLLLQHSKTAVPTKNTKLSAVEQLKLSKQQIQPTPKHQQDDMSILELSRSPRNIGNRKFNTLNSPRGTPDKPTRSVPKLLSPRSQWRFASPRSDVLSSTIPEDCREDDSPNSSGERRSRNMEENTSKAAVNLFGIDSKSSGTNYRTVTERIQAQRAQFFGTANTTTNDCSYRNRETTDTSVLPTLETAF